MPFLIFAPRRMRHFACVAMALLQMLILLTGNYTFFNWLTLALCVLLLEDRALAKFVPRRWRTLFHIKGASPALPSIPAEPAPAILDEPGSANHAPPATRHASRITPLRWPRWLTVPLAAVVLTVTLLQVVETFRGRFVWAEPAAALHEWIYPLRSVNHYGLFAVMTTSRPEIIVEGSDDGTAWRAYEFKYKPGDLKRRPAFVAPHQPRLDWQMWFAALGSYRGNPWFMNFCTRLLQGSPEVLELLEKNPFPNQPPHFIRARVYDYHFTNFATRRAEGTWWRRELKGDYCPTLSLREARAAER